MKRFLAYLCLALIFSQISFGKAQEEDIITLIPNELIGATLTAEQGEVTYQFEAEAGEFYSLYINGPTFADEILWLDDQGELILDLADYYYYPVVTSDKLLIERAGTHQIIIRASEDFMYTLQAIQRQTPLLTYAEPQAEDQLDYSTPFLPFVFEGEAGDDVDIQVNAEYFDAVLNLYGPDGELIASDDDSGGNLFPRLKSVILPQSGRYEIRVSSYYSNTLGYFTVKITDNQTLAEQTIPFGEWIEVTLSDENPNPRFYFDGKSGDKMEMVLDDPDEIASVRAEQANGSPIKEIEFRIPTEFPNWFVLPESDSGYWIVIRPSEIGKTGSIRFKLDQRGENSLDGDQEAELLRVQLSEKDSSHTFYLRSGGYVLAGLRINQFHHFHSVSAYSITIRLGDEILTSYTFEGIMGIHAMENYIEFQTSEGELEITLEYFGTDPMWFTVSGEVYYGEG